MTVWLTLIGCGEEGLSSLSEAARRYLDQAELIYGSSRFIGDPLLLGKTYEVWLSPFQKNIEHICRNRGRSLCVLATGDPMYYGIGSSLLEVITTQEMRILPSPSAFSLAAARLAWSLQCVECLSLCGRPSSLIEPFIAPDARLLILGEGEKTLLEVAERLCARGFGESQLTLLEHMGGTKERVLTMTADQVFQEPVASFSTLAVHCVAGSQAIILPRIPGLPDEVFRHDGQLTKSELRSVTLAALSPYSGAILWDIGAGCGAISIEWMRSARDAQAVAVEKDPSRLAMIEENASVLGVPYLRTVSGEAPAVLRELPVPDAVFMGCAVAREDIFQECWHFLRSGGIFVANAVTLDATARLIERQKIYGGFLVRIDISLLDAIGSGQILRPRLSVLQWRLRKRG